MYFFIKTLFIVTFIDKAITEIISNYFLRPSFRDNNIWMNVFLTL